MLSNLMGPLGECRSTSSSRSVSRTSSPVSNHPLTIEDSSCILGDNMMLKDSESSDTDLFLSETVFRQVSFDRRLSRSHSLSSDRSAMSIESNRFDNQTNSLATFCFDNRIEEPMSSDVKPESVASDSWNNMGLGAFSNSANTNSDVPLSLYEVDTRRRSAEPEPVGADDMEKRLKEALFELKRMRAKVEEAEEEGLSLRRSCKALETARELEGKEHEQTERKLQEQLDNANSTVKQLWQQIEEIDNENVRIGKVCADLEKKAKTPSIDITLSKTSNLWNKKLNQDKIARDKADQKAAQESVAAKPTIKADKEKEQKLNAWLSSRGSSRETDGKSTSTTHTAKKSTRFFDRSSTSAPGKTWKTVQKVKDSRFMRFENRVPKA